MMVSCRQALSTHLGLSRVLIGLYQNLAHSDDFADGRDGRLQDLPCSQDGHSTELALVRAPRIDWTLHCVHHHSLQGPGVWPRGWGDPGGGVTQGVVLLLQRYSPHMEEKRERTQSEDKPNGLNRIQSHHVLCLGSCISWRMK